MQQLTIEKYKMLEHLLYPWNTTGNAVIPTVARVVSAFLTLILTLQPYSKKAEYISQQLKTVFMNPKRDVCLSSFNPLHHKGQKLLEKSLWFALLGCLPGKQFILRQKQMIVTAAQRPAVNYVWSEKHFVTLRFLLNIRQVFYCQKLLKAFQTNLLLHKGNDFFL